jgi:two-component system OmpR family response regulator
MEFGKAKKIFVVDDDPLIAEALQDCLTSKIPHLVSAYQTGEECMGHLAEQPDIVILDYYLNSVSKDAANGMEVLQHIKKYYPGIHVIMLSSLERYGTALQTIQKGAEQFVVKDKDAFEKIAAMIEEMA